MKFFGSLMWSFGWLCLIVSITFGAAFLMESDGAIDDRVTGALVMLPISLVMLFVGKKLKPSPSRTRAPVDS